MIGAIWTYPPKSFATTAFALRPTEPELAAERRATWSTIHLYGRQWRATAPGCRPVGYSQAATGGMSLRAPCKGSSSARAAYPLPQKWHAHRHLPDWRRLATRQSADYSRTSAHEQRENIFLRSSYNLTDDIQVMGRLNARERRSQGLSQILRFVGTAGPHYQDRQRLSACVAHSADAGRRRHAIQPRLAQEADFGILRPFTDRYMTFYVVGATGSFKAFDTDWTWDTFGRIGMTTGFYGHQQYHRSKYLAGRGRGGRSDGTDRMQFDLDQPERWLRAFNPMGSARPTIPIPVRSMSSLRSGKSHITRPSWRERHRQSDLDMGRPRLRRVERGISL